MKNNIRKTPIQKGIVEQIKETYHYPNFINKEEFRSFLLSLGTDSYCGLWKSTFNEEYKDFVNKLLT